LRAIKLLKSVRRVAQEIKYEDSVAVGLNPH
jgi:hypothetical protein